MAQTYYGKKQAKTRKGILALIKKCQLEKKAARKVETKKFPVVVDGFLYAMIFSKPAKVVDCNFENWTLDIKMQLKLVAHDPYLPDSKGYAVMRYKILFESVKNEIQLRGATIQEMDFSQSLMKLLKGAMKKKAGKLNLNFPLEECY